MESYRSNEKVYERSSLQRDQPVRTCPECSSAFGSNRKFCPGDGAALVSQPIRKSCPQCSRDYSPDVQVCFADGARLLNVMPAGEGYESTRTIDGQEYGVRRLEGVQEDHMRRSMCPSCGSWKNWTDEGINYLCNGCGAHYLYEGDDIFKVKGKIDEKGNLLSVTDAGTFRKDRETLEDSPFYKLLSEIDVNNRDHWVKTFKHFKEGQFNRSWNWPSFFLGTPRYFLKGMSGRGVLYLFAGIALYALVTAVSGRQGLEPYPFQAITGIGVNVFYASMGSNDYFRFCLKHKDDIKGAKRAKTLGKINIVLFAIVWTAASLLGLGRPV